MRIDVSRRAFLGGVVTVAATWARPAPSFARTETWTLDEFAKNVRRGGPPKDGIPPIDQPKYTAAAEADKSLRPTDIVFGLQHAGAVRAYPQKILVWHEIVNEDLGGEKVSITYCPLTGSVVGFRGRSKVDGAPLTFGTTGNLVNSNLLMYDRQTDSTWPQILGAAITGPNRGVVIEEIPLEWTTWERWRRAHGDTLVLSTQTGYLRAYGSDPYGSYDGSGTYYQAGGPFFPVMASDRRFPPKEVVVGVKVGRETLGIPRALVARQTVVDATLGDPPLVALWDEALEAARVFVRRAGTTALTLRAHGNAFVDAETGSRWSPAGRCEDGRLAGTELRRLPAYDVMWFAWYAFYPATGVAESTG